MKVFYPPDVWSLSRFACGVSIFVCFYFELRRVLFTHTHKSRTWNFFPAREQIQKYWVTREKRPWTFSNISPVNFFFCPWTFLKKAPVKRNLAREHFQNRNVHGCLFVSREKKKHCVVGPLLFLVLISLFVYTIYTKSIYGMSIFTV